MNFSRKASVLFMAAVLFTGLGRIAILPPFEGADETAHYSRILSKAWPPQNRDDLIRIDKSVYDYYPAGPMSPGWLRNDGLQRHDPRIASGKTASDVYPDYHAFFARPGMADKYQKLFREKPAPRAFAPAPTYNWQVQHPPAYYALLGAVARALPDMTLHGRLFALRAFGFLLACAGFAAGLIAARRHLLRAGREDAERVIAFAAFYPFLMPSFFSDLTRLGNDTLALAAFAAMWIFLLRHLRKPGDSSEWIGLGVAMGGALLVKATMLPVVFGLLLFVAFVNVRALKWKGFAPAGIAAGMAALISVKWYAPYLSEYLLTMSGASVFSRGWGKTLPVGTALSFAFDSVSGAVYYFTDWVYIRFNPAIHAALLLPAFAAALAWAWRVAREQTLLAADALAFWATGPLLGALAAHSVFTALSVGADNAAPTAAYYAHTTAPALALCIGLGLAAIGRLGRVPLAALGLGGILGTGYLLLRQAQMYAGCWWEDVKAGVFAREPCFTDPVLMVRHLEVLGWPGAGITLLAAGFLCAITGLFLALKDKPGLASASAPGGH